MSGQAENDGGIERREALDRRAQAAGPLLRVGRTREGDGVDRERAGDARRRLEAAVAQRLGLHFIKTGRLEPGDGRLFARLQKYRLEADYSVEFVLTREALEEDFAGCGAFVERARALIALLLA